MSPLNTNASVLVRFFGLACDIFGAMWLAAICGATILTLIDAPMDVRLAVWGVIGQQLPGPIWLLTGVLILRNSAMLAEFVGRHVKTEDQN